MKRAAGFAVQCGHLDRLGDRISLPRGFDRLNHRGALTRSPRP
jgi:hypothetical protein